MSMDDLESARRAMHRSAGERALVRGGTVVMILIARAINWLADDVQKAPVMGFIYYVPAKVLSAIHRALFAVVFGVQMYRITKNNIALQSLKPACLR